MSTYLKALKDALEEDQAPQSLSLALYKPDGSMELDEDNRTIVHGYANDPSQYTSCKDVSSAMLQTLKATGGQIETASGPAAVDLVKRKLEEVQARFTDYEKAGWDEDSPYEVGNGCAIRFDYAQHSVLLVVDDDFTSIHGDVDGSRKPCEIIEAWAGSPEGSGIGESSIRCAPLHECVLKPGKGPAAGTYRDATRDGPKPRLGELIDSIEDILCDKENHRDAVLCMLTRGGGAGAFEEGTDNRDLVVHVVPLAPPEEVTQRVKARIAAAQEMIRMTNPGLEVKPSDNELREVMNQLNIEDLPMPGQLQAAEVEVGEAEVIDLGAQQALPMQARSELDEIRAAYYERKNQSETVAALDLAVPKSPGMGRR